MDFSFENINYPLFTAPQLDMFGISQLNAASYEPLPLPSSTTSATGGEDVNVGSPTPGKQKKPRKRRSTDGKPYPMIKCSECPKEYRDNAAGQRHLQLHMTTHDPDSQSKFNCTKCAKTFSNEVYLKRHLNLCGVSRKRRSSIGSSTCDESSSDTLIISSPNADTKMKVATINEEHTAGEVQIDFQAF